MRDAGTRQGWPILGSMLLLVSGCLVKGNPEYVDGAGGDMTVVPPALPEVLLPREASFRMGTAPDGGGEGNERPEYPVTVEAFYLEVFEVTVEAYGKCVAAGVCRAPDTGEHCNKSDKPGHPVTCVSWEDADAFCQWTKRRLPTEEEWEYAARGMTTPKAEYPFGTLADKDLDGNLCWKHSNGTCPVGSYRRTLLGTFNDQGIGDLAGNVWEWTANELVKYPTRKSCTNTCVIRGGSWGNADPTAVRAAYRYSDLRMTRSYVIGFRCARTP